MKTIRRDAQEKLEQVIEFCELQDMPAKIPVALLRRRVAAGELRRLRFLPAAKEEFDATAIAHRILSAVIHTGERFGITHVAAVLQGSGNSNSEKAGARCSQRLWRCQ